MSTAGRNPYTAQKIARAKQFEARVEEVGKYCYRREEKDASKVLAWKIRHSLCELVRGDE